MDCLTVLLTVKICFFPFYSSIICVSLQHGLNQYEDIFNLTDNKQLCTHFSISLAFCEGNPPITGWVLMFSVSVFCFCVQLYGHQYSQRTAPIHQPHPFLWLDAERLLAFVPSHHSLFYDISQHWPLLHVQQVCEPGGEERGFVVEMVRDDS